MNQRPSKEGVGWYTPDVFSNPFEVAISAFEGIKRAVSAPLETAFPTLARRRSQLHPSAWSPTLTLL